MRTVTPAAKAPGDRPPLKWCWDANVCATVRGLTISGVYPATAFSQKAVKQSVTPSRPPKLESNTFGSEHSLELHSVSLRLLTNITALAGIISTEQRCGGVFTERDRAWPDLMGAGVFQCVTPQQPFSL